METNVKQYNGIILITGYLQRLFVRDAIYEKLNGPIDVTRKEKIKSLIYTTQDILAKFENTKLLHEDQKLKLILVVDEINHLMKTYFNPLANNFVEKLAIVGSSLYAEQKVNDGIIRLGKLFAREINRDYEMRSKFYADRTKMIDYLVHTLAKNEKPDEDFLKPIDPWYENIMRNKDGILSDIEKIYDLIK